MLTRDLLRTAYLHGAVLWVEDGNVCLYHPDAEQFPAELVEQIEEQKHELAELLLRENVCWCCDGNEVRFNRECGRYECTRCGWHLRFNPRRWVYDAGRYFAFPAVLLPDGYVIPQGKQAWVHWCSTATLRQLRDAYRTLARAGHFARKVLKVLE